MMIRKFGPTTEHLRKITAVVAAAMASVAISMGVLLSPMLIGSLSQSGQDWTRLSEIGEAYGPVSALLATLALAAVSVSLLLQRSQLGHERLWLQREMTLNLLKIAMDNPIYRQCWGARISPDEVDESLFYYINLMLMSWSHAWEHRIVSEEQIRTYAELQFESEVPRLYWERFGGLRSSARSRERAFYRIINNAFLKAVHAGPPSRLYEPQAAHLSSDGVLGGESWPTNPSSRRAPKVSRSTTRPKRQL
jgi:hypothetical protein